MYEKTICKVSEIFFYSLQPDIYLKSCTMPNLLTSRQYFDYKFSTRTSFQTKSKCTDNTQNSSVEVLSQMNFNIIKDSSRILEHKGTIKSKLWN